MGGMDRANFALAKYLLAQGHAVHVVTHYVDRDLLHPNLTVRTVPRPGSSYLLGEVLLDVQGRRVARAMTAASPNTQVLVNGGNCIWPAINWVHALHHRWPSLDQGAPTLARFKNRLAKRRDKNRESRALRLSTLAIVNSQRTADDLVQSLNYEPERIRVAYLAADPEFRPREPAERQAARRSLGIAANAKVAAFIGALGWDDNKGVGCLLESWKHLSEDERFTAELLIIGSGGALERLKKRTAAVGNRVRFLGTRADLPEFLCAVDLVVSPSAYEAYGLATHEAICCNVPVVVSAQAGIAELFPDSLRHMLLQQRSVAELTTMLRQWHDHSTEWQRDIQPLGARLRARSWDDMAREISEFSTTSKQRGAA